MQKRFKSSFTKWFLSTTIVCFQVTNFILPVFALPSLYGDLFSCSWVGPLSKLWCILAPVAVIAGAMKKRLAPIGCVSIVLFLYFLVLGQRLIPIRTWVVVLPLVAMIFFVAMIVEICHFLSTELRA